MTNANTPNVIDLEPLDHNKRFQTNQNMDDVARRLMSLDAGRIGSWSHNVPNGEIWGDKLVAELLGLEFDAQPWAPEDFYNSIHPDDTQYASDAVARTYSGEDAFYDVELRRRPASADAPVMWIGARAQVTQRDNDGAPIWVLGVNWDVTETKQYETNLTLLASEMDHRVKNAFAVIRALINIGAGTSTDIGSFADTLRNQVEAMATAHRLSARLARSHSVPEARVSLSDVIDTVLAPWLQQSDAPETDVHVVCDPAISLRPNAIAAFAMMFYELSTNATKYGPLGQQGGQLFVEVVQDDTGAIRMEWREHCAVTAVPNAEPNSGPGFGEILINHCASNLNAQATTEMTADGLRFQLNMKPPAQR